MHLVCVKKCIGLFLEYTFQRNVRVVLEKHTTNFYITLLLSSFWPSLKNYNNSICCILRIIIKTLKYIPTVESQKQRDVVLKSQC